MNKTPVSILQEMMVKKQIVPNFELVHDGGGTHINTFIYQVTCDGLTALGMGRCKKEAKHEAARVMLETIAKTRNYPQLPASSEDSPQKTASPSVKTNISSSNLNVPFLNAVGALQEKCSENGLEEPEYHLISDVGPPHARVFTYQCVVATFKEEGVATTKKQAKQEASKKMLNRLRDLISDSKLTNENVKPHVLIANEIAKAKYPSFSKLQPTVKNNLGLKISQYHVSLRDQLDEEIRVDLLNKLNSIVPEKSECYTDEEAARLLSVLEDCLAAFDLELSVVSLPSELCSHIIAVKVNSCPDVVQITYGDTKETVLYKALRNLINTMIYFLQ